MTRPVRADVQACSRLEELLARYAELKPQADEAATRLKAVTDAIKNELQNAAPAAQKVDVDHPMLAQPLRLSYVESWRLDAKQLKAERPEVYVAFAQKSGAWQLRGVSA
jgi:predicted phage-related endonuclease